MTDVDAIKICSDEAIVAFGGRPVNEIVSDFRDESSLEIFRSPPKVELAFKKVVKCTTIG